MTVAHRTARLPGGIALHVAEAGPADGPLTLLLHGFPDCWYSWRHLLPPLAAAGLRVLAPDQRGYGASSRPPRVRDYRIDALLSDILRLLDGRRAHVVGHDWGGALAWALAMLHPEAVDRLVILNAPHPATFVRELRHLDQLKKSWYMGFFQLPWLPERTLHRELEATWRRGTGRAWTAEERATYRAIFPDPAAFRGPISWYRALARHDLLTVRARTRPIAAPTLVLWGEQDPVLGLPLLDGLEAWVPDLQVQRVPAAGHFVHLDAPGAVELAILGHLRPRPLTPPAGSAPAPRPAP